MLWTASEPLEEETFRSDFFGLSTSNKRALISRALHFNSKGYI